MEEKLTDYIDIDRGVNGNLKVNFSRRKESRIYKKLSDLGIRRIKDNKFYNSLNKDVPIKYFNFNDLKLFLYNYLSRLEVGKEISIAESNVIENFLSEKILIKRNDLMRDLLKD